MRTKLAKVNTWGVKWEKNRELWPKLEGVKLFLQRRAKSTMLSPTSGHVCKSTWTIGRRRPATTAVFCTSASSLTTARS
jgi:hypothetical protein